MEGQGGDGGRALGPGGQRAGGKAQGQGLSGLQHCLSGRQEGDLRSHSLHGEESL